MMYLRGIEKDYKDGFLGPNIKAKFKGHFKVPQKEQRSRQKTQT